MKGENSMGFRYEFEPDSAVLNIDGFNSDKDLKAKFDLRELIRLVRDINNSESLNEDNAIDYVLELTEMVELPEN